MFFTAFSFELFYYKSGISFVSYASHNKIQDMVKFVRDFQQINIMSPNIPLS